MEREGTEPDVERAIDELESGRQDMEERSEELSDKVDAARHEWRARQADSQVPGAVTPEEEAGDEPEQEPSGAEESDVS